MLTLAALHGAIASGVFGDAEHAGILAHRRHAHPAGAYQLWENRAIRPAV
jgi:hypothetical protein